MDNIVILVAKSSFNPHRPEGSPIRSLSPAQKDWISLRRPSVWRRSSDFDDLPRLLGRLLKLIRVNAAMGLLQYDCQGHVKSADRTRLAFDV
jgi:hypothetical protein